MTWSHRGGFAPQISGTLPCWAVLASLGTRELCFGCPQPGLALLCPGPKGENTTPAQQGNNKSLMESHKIREGRDGPSGVSGLGYRAWGVFNCSV